MLRLITSINCFSISAINILGFTYGLAGGAYMSKPPDSNLVELKREDYGQWIGGKTIGTINLSGNHYLIKSGNKIIYRVEKSVKNAEIDCKKILYEYCKNSDKLINEYRYCYHVSGNYLDVKIGDVQIQCDIQDKELIEKYE